MTTVNINESFVAEKALNYAKLSELAYAKWEEQPGGQWTLATGQKDFVYYSSLLDSLGEYSVVGYVDKRGETGYSGTIFRAPDGTLILANRGTEFGLSDTDLLDLLAADKVGRLRQIPTEQFRSMADFINSNIGSENFEVTGHSLGGCLAQIAKAAYSSQVQEVYTYDALGAYELTQDSNYKYIGPSSTQGKVLISYGSHTYEWDSSVWQKYCALNFSQIDGSKIYNLSGTSDLLSSQGGLDIGGEVFIGGTHSIRDTIENINIGTTFYVDPRRPVTVIATNRDEILKGNYDSGHYVTAPSSVTLVAGYGNDVLWGSDQGDILYGDLPPEFDEAARNKSGNGSGYAGKDRLVGGKGNDSLYGGNGYDTYISYSGDGNDVISDTDNQGKIIVDFQEIGLGSISTGNVYRVGTGNIWKDPSGNITISHDSSWTISLPDSSTITLVGNIQDGDFGINMFDVLKNPTPYKEGVWVVWTGNRD